MKKLSTLVALMLATGVAWAQGAGGKEEKAAPPAAAMEMPKPAPELAQLNDMVGTWKCTGKGNMGGKEFETTGTMKAAWDLEKNWVVAKVDGKAKGMPGSHKEVSY